MRLIKSLVSCAAIVALAGCATIQRTKARASDFICDNEEAVIVALQASNDIAAINAVRAYCGAFVPPMPPVPGRVS